MRAAEARLSRSASRFDHYDRILSECVDAERVAAANRQRLATHAGRPAIRRRTTMPWSSSAGLPISIWRQPRRPNQIYSSRSAEPCLRQSAGSP